MKTFTDLIEEVQKPGLCHRCGGCVTFCTAINFGALELDPDGKPRYADEAKCIECGLCHTICPEIDELDAETRKSAGWAPPIGRVLETSIARATDSKIRKKLPTAAWSRPTRIHAPDKERACCTAIDEPDRNAPVSEDSSPRRQKWSSRGTRRHRASARG